MTTTESMTLAALIAARDEDQRPTPRKWNPITRRLVRDGLLRITSRERVFRISDDGRAELVRLESVGVVPVEWTVARAKAHDGIETGHKSGRELRAEMGRAS